MRALVALLTALAACSHEKLDFALPTDAGRDDASKDAASGAMILGDGAIDVGTSKSAADGSAADDIEDDLSSERRFDDDPDGYPAAPGQWPPWCEQMQSFDELCGNDLDEDCDGTVDEFSDVGQPCLTGACGQGHYVCDTVTNALLCQGGHGCMVDTAMPCGDGFVSADEQCDPGAPNEKAGVTCTFTCERPLFVRCVEAGTPNSELCSAVQTCNERIGACVPVIGPNQPRCPKLRVEGSEFVDEIYPMIETEDGECWITCSESEQCPSVLSECYMGFCAVPL